VFTLGGVLWPLFAFTSQAASIVDPVVELRGPEIDCEAESPLVAVWTGCLCIFIPKRDMIDGMVNICSILTFHFVAHPLVTNMTHWDLRHEASDGEG
jgi:hypothetical protein